MQPLNKLGYFIFLGALTLVFACSNDSADQSSSSSSSARAEEGPRPFSDVETEGCLHPLMPLVKGARWQYELGAEDAPRKTQADIRVVDTVRAGNAITAKINRQVGPSKTSVEAYCNNDGVSFIAFFIPLGPPLPIKMNFAPRVTKRSGALLPPLAKLRKNATWDHEVTAHTERPGGKALTLDSSWMVKGRFVGEDEVTVPAGRYKVTQVELTVSGHHAPPAEKEIAFSDRIMDPPPMVFTYSFAKGVGVVLIEGEPPEGTKRRARWALTNVELLGSND